MIQFEIPKNQSSIIKVIGVGGGGSNAVNYMYNLGIDGVDFIVCNTDSQALTLSPVTNKIQLGPLLTQGLGAGANPEIGMKASEESLEDIHRILSMNTRMAFITAGMGGGTGTGGAPVVSKICRELGILTVGIVTLPFTYEGRKRMKQAQEGIERMREQVDTILIISNDKLREQFGNLPFTMAFAKADDILATAAKCITDVITTTGQINVDFADVCTVMRNGGVAILGNAIIAGENRALHAVEQALSSPLLNDNDIRGAKWILLNITSSPGDHEHTMDEAEAIQAHVQAQAGDGCDVILGMGHDANLGDKIAVTIIATGFTHREISADHNERRIAEREKVVVRLNEPATPPRSAAPQQPTSGPGPNATAPSLVEMLRTNNITSSRNTQPAADQRELYTLKSAEPVVPAKQQSSEQEEPADPGIQLIIKNDGAASGNGGDGKGIFNTNEYKREIQSEDRKRFEEDKKALEDRAERLRRMSFNVTSETGDDLEQVPAYIRKQLNVDNDPNKGSQDTFYSGYSVGYNNNEDPSKTTIQTINTFLHGKKPD